MTPLATIFVLIGAVGFLAATFRNSDSGEARVLIGLGSMGLMLIGSIL